MSEVEESSKSNMHVVESKDSSEIRKMRFPSLIPIDDKCMHCRIDINKYERQEIMLDPLGRPKRVCGSCLLKKYDKI